jgi:uncharacterized integral membrane protein
MKTRGWSVLVVLVLLGVFAALNWSTFRQPAPLDFLFATVEAPLGVVMLLAVVAVALIHLFSIGRIEIAYALESRRLLQELGEARKLADSAEMSRVASLQQFLEREITEMELKLDMLLDRGGMRLPPDPPAKY